MHISDTIAAIATGNTISAIGIVRISGENAITAADSIFRATNGTKMCNAGDRVMYYGELTDVHGDLIDLCLCMVSRAPHSYTGEDTVEFHCHGSPIVLSEVLRALLSLGVRQAETGEFTKRAFLGGRMDLTQAEAVIDIIEAETLLGAKNAAGQLRGSIGAKINVIYDRLVDIIAHFHAVIDYPDEDIDEFKLQDYIATLCKCERELSNMLGTHERGRILRSGIPTAIVGRTNTGKSTLLNALLGFERAIVTDIPGTTRDTIEEKVLIGNVLLRLIDTAGLRKTEDAVEKLGVERTLAALGEARLVILVLDGSVPLREDDIAAIRSIPLYVPVVVAINKCDLPHSEEQLNIMTETVNTELLQECNKPKLEINSSKSDESVSDKPRLTFCQISALTGEGIEQLEAEIKRLFPDFDVAPRGELITSIRQADAIKRAVDSLRLSKTALTDKVNPDAVLTDIEIALSVMGEVTGKTMREDIVSRVFERFCVGK